MAEGLLKQNFFKKSVSIVPITASGGTVTEITVDDVDYRVHTFTSNGTFSVESLGSTNGNIECLLVGGGGGGGGRRAGGGGAGEVKFFSEVVSIQSYPIIVGLGALDRKGRIFSKEGSGDNGENSSAFGFTSLGGGGGGSRNVNGNNGGSGGGAGHNSTFGISGSTNGFGNDGGTSNSTDRSGGGGGGAGTAGSSTGLKNNDINSGGDGGSGIYFGDKFGNSLGVNGWVGGGGGGGAYSGTSLPGDGGTGGGGVGQQEDPFDSGVNTKHDGISGTGGGGGGASGDSSHAAAGIGGSGIVVVRYPLIEPPILFFTRIDFDGYTLNEQPDDWTVENVITDISWNVISDSSATENRALDLVVNSNQDGISVITSNEVGDLEYFDVHSAVANFNPNGNNRTWGGIAYRFSKSGNIGNWYQCEISRIGGIPHLRVRKIIDQDLGTTISNTEDTTDLISPVSLGEWSGSEYWNIRTVYDSTGTLRVKYWAPNDSEPTNFQINISDSSPPPIGKIGAVVSQNLRTDLDARWSFFKIQEL